MEQGIFRKGDGKTLESPEELTDYISVTGPRVWIVLCALLALLLGGIAWAVFGSIETVVKQNGIVYEGEVSCYLTEPERQLVQPGHSANIGGVAGVVAYVADTPESYEQSCARLKNDAYLIFVAGIQKNDWQYYARLTPEEPIPDGPVEINILVERRHPISFVFGQEGDR